MNPAPHHRQLRWLLGGAAAALVITLSAVVALGPAEASADWVRFFGRFHPLFVHLPIGLMLIVAAAEVASVKATLRARLDPVITPALVVLVATALVAFIAGLLLARGGGYPDTLLVPHKRLATGGVLLLCASLATWSMQRHRSSSRWRQGYRAALGSSVLALGVGAHFGGSMTHGEAYLVRFAPQPIAGWFGVEPAKTAPARRAPAADPEVYATLVQPVLTKYCVNCHGPDKAKGELRLDSYAGLMKGGDTGAAVVPGVPEKSHVVTLLRLPLEDIEHMPPKGKPQPSQAQIELISWWVLRGASARERVREVLPPASVLELLKAADRAGVSKDSPSIAPKAGHSPLESGSTAEPESEAPEAEPGSGATEPAEAASNPKARAVALEARGLVYQDLVAPLLAARCAKCHGPAKQKGRLRVDSLGALAKGGKGGAAVLPGNPTGSPLIERLRLPVADEGHMPPADEPQLTAEQVLLLEWWIREGAEAATSRERLPERLAALRPPPATAPSRSVGPESALEASGSGAEVLVTDRPPPVEPGAPVEPAPPEVLAELPEEVKLFEDFVLPLLRDDCGDCHLDEPLMGDLSLASFEDLLRGGVVVPGEPESSELFRRVTLPASDEERMPPPGAEPLSASEIAALRFWILEGAEPGATWGRQALPAEVARAVHGRRVARSASAAPRSTSAAAGRDPGAGQVAPVERATGRGCGACALGSETGSGGQALTALGLLTWLGAWKQRMTRRAG